MPGSFARITCIICASVAVGCPLGSPTDHSRPIGHGDMTLDASPTEDLLVFNATGAGGRDLYLLRLEDSRVTRIAETPEYEVCPSFSADGKFVVYAAGVPGDRADHLFKRAVAGGTVEQLTRGDVNDSSPRFSPDGSLIVFARDKSYAWGGLAANWDVGGVICLVRSDGSGEKQLTGDESFAYEPRFSADGKSVVYATPAGRASVSIDGASPATTLPGPSVAVPSPDATRLAYARGQYSPDLKIYISDEKGASERLLTPGLGGSYHPVFSHDGERLYFQREEWPDGPSGESKFAVWEVTIDGATTRCIADSQLFDAPLEWKNNKSR